MTMVCLQHVWQRKQVCGHMEDVCIYCGRLREDPMRHEKPWVAESDVEKPWGWKTTIYIYGKGERPHNERVFEAVQLAYGALKANDFSGCRVDEVPDEPMSAKLSFDVEDVDQQPLDSGGE